MEYSGKQYEGAGYTGQQAYAGHYYQQPSQAIQYQYLGEQPRYGSTPYTISKATETIARSKATDTSARFSRVTETSARPRRASRPDRVFLTISPPNGLRLSNLASSTVEVFCEQIFPMWPKGVTRQERYGHDWRVIFSGSPWNSKGHESNMAQRMICRVFLVLAAQGYVYLTSINTGCVFKRPQLMFVRAHADRLARFFAMSLDSAGNRFTFVYPPATVVNSLGLSLRREFPHRIVNEHTSDDGVFTITLKSRINAMNSEKKMLMAHILKSLNDMAFKLDAVVPLARYGLFGMSGRKKIWVFKGSMSR